MVGSILVRRHQRPVDPVDQEIHRRQAQVMSWSIPENISVRIDPLEFRVDQVSRAPLSKPFSSL